MGGSRAPSLLSGQVGRCPRPDTRDGLAWTRPVRETCLRFPGAWWRQRVYTGALSVVEVTWEQQQ